MRFFIFFISALLFAGAECKTMKHIILDSPGYIGGAGLFHNFSIVLGCLDLYDRKDELSLTIDFKDHGLYYTADKGSNWWSYYFEKTFYPNRMGSTKKGVLKILKDPEKAEFGNGVHFFFSRERAFELISKYIVIKKEITDEVKTFHDKFLKGNPIIGVHYRGCDKWLESNWVSHQTMLEVIATQFLKYPGAKIYVATDEEPFLELIKEQYGKDVVYIDAERSQDGKPLHYTTLNPYQHGREALIDCLLLAKSSVLIRTNSNLSAVSAFFNPKSEVINLNQVNDFLYQGLIKKGVLNSLNLKSEL